MTINWTEIDSSTETTSGYSLIRKTYSAPYGGGYLLRIDRYFVNTGASNLRIESPSSLVFVADRPPADFSWTLEATENNSATFGGATIANVIKTYSGIPRTSGGGQIGTDRFFMVEKTTLINGLVSCISSSSICVTPVTINQIFYGS